MPLPPEPVRREARIRKPSLRHLPLSIQPEKEVVVRPPAPLEPSDELAQLQKLLTLCTDLSKEVAKPDTEGVPEPLQRIRTEFERQRREQRKVLQQRITSIRELMENIARRAAPEELAAKRVRPLSVEVCSDGDEGSEVRVTALFVAEPTGALGKLFDVPVPDLAEARSTSRAPESLAASEGVLLRKSPSRPRSVDPAPSPTVEVRAAGELASASDVPVAPRPRAIAVEIPSEAAVQSAVRQLMALFEAARQFGAHIRRREPAHLDDAPHDRRGHPVHEEFVPALWSGVRRSSLRAVRLGRTPRCYLCVCAVYVYVCGVCGGVLVWTPRPIRVPRRCRC